MIVNTKHGPKPLDEGKVNEVLQWACEGRSTVDWSEIAVRANIDWYDGITTAEICQSTIMATVSLIELHPDYELVAARLLLREINKQALPQKVGTVPLLDTEKLLRYRGVKTLADRYLQRRDDGTFSETVDMFWGRIAKALAIRGGEGEEFYQVMSTLKYIPSTPTLFNAGKEHSQLASCYIQHVGDSLEGIFTAYHEQAGMSKWAGGIGTDWSKVRASGSKIQGTGGDSSGLVPWLKIQNDIQNAVNQGGKRKGAHCAYLDVTHPDIMEFLDLRSPIGDDRLRCYDLYTAVWVPDLFMQALRDGEDWYMFCPSECPDLYDSWGDEFETLYAKCLAEGKHRKSLPAATIWRQIITRKFETGYPYICFKDTCNRDNPMKKTGLVRSSNLCVAPETLVLTDKGHRHIIDLEGEEVNVWNGTEWSKVVPVKTGLNQKLITVTLSDGSSLDCTEYHKFYVRPDYYSESVLKQANELRPGDKLEKLVTPVVAFGDAEADMYTQGLYSAEGCEYKGRNHIYLYGKKRELIGACAAKSVHAYQPNQDRQRITVSADYKKFSVPMGANVESRLSWLAGYLDGDGALLLNENTPSIQVCSVNFDFLRQVQLMLQTLGVQSKIRKSRDEGPGIQGYWCQTLYRLLIGAAGVKALKSLGLPTKRVILPEHDPNRECSHYVTVESVENKGRISDTYCFNEPLRHRGVFNGVLTGNCTEITLNTSEDEIAVCNLGSINLERIESLEELSAVSRIAVRMLNNVIDKMWYPNEKAKSTNTMTRPLGLGIMGAYAVQYDTTHPLHGIKTPVLLSVIKDAALRESVALAEKDGPFPAYQDSTFMTPRRNSHLLAIAPTETIADIAGTTNSCEPPISNLYVKSGLAGTFPVINRWLVRDLEELGLWSAEMSERIKALDGSIQKISEIPEDLREKYKTAFELDQKELMNEAAQRQKYVCQSQSLNQYARLGITGSELSELYQHAWRIGLKTTYYIKIQTGSHVEKVTIDPNKHGATHMTGACKITDPECDACQ